MKTNLTKTEKYSYFVVAVIILIIFSTLFSSCKQGTVYPDKKYIVGKSDDDNWTTTAMIYCDSVTMENEHKAILSECLSEVDW